MSAAVPSPAPRPGCLACEQQGRLCMRCQRYEARERLIMKRRLRQAGVYIPAALRQDTEALRRLVEEFAA